MRTPRIKVWLTKDQVNLIVDDFQGHIDSGSDISKDFEKVVAKILKAQPQEA